MHLAGQYAYAGREKVAGLLGAGGGIFKRYAIENSGQIESLGDNPTHKNAVAPAERERRHQSDVPRGLLMTSASHVWSVIVYLTSIILALENDLPSGEESESMKARVIQPGDPVIVRPLDARLVTGDICVGGILQTVGGTKVRVRSGYAVYLVDASQIIGASKGTKSGAE